jgi:hypothetical protein
MYFEEGAPTQTQPHRKRKSSSERTTVLVDKRNATVILDYSNKSHTLLADPTYESTNWNLIKQVEKQIKKLIEVLHPSQNIETPNSKRHQNAFLGHKGLCPCALMWKVQPVCCKGSGGSWNWDKG